MKKIIMSLALITLCWLSANAQQNIQIKVEIKNNQEPLLGATVYLPELNIGAVTDFEGIATLNNVPDGEHAITISYVGFQTINDFIVVPSETPFIFNLIEGGNELDEVVIQSSRSTRTVQKIPTRIEFIGAEELGEKAIMNPTNISMVLRESTGIQMQQTSLSSGNSNIRIQGLDGRYTQLLRDGFPLFGGFSSGLSILQIPPLDLAQFEIIKGSSSTLYGGGAIAGLVNMVSKTPDFDPDLEIMLTQTQALESTANVFFSQRGEKFGTTLYASGHHQKEYDPEDDGFSNLPKTKSVSFNPKFFYYPFEKITFWLGLNGTYDDRVGGDMQTIENGEEGMHQYTETNISKRLSSQAVFSTQLDASKSLNIKNSISYFNRDLEVPDLFFKGESINTFSEATLQIEKERTDWIVGANVYTNDFDEAKQSPLQRDQNDVTLGAFTKNVFDFSENWILETGFRADYAKDWGFFPLPRLAILYKKGSFSSRIGGGLGYKIPDIFTEEAEFINFQNVLGIDKDLLKAERSYGANLDFNYQTRLLSDLGFSVNQLFYLTAINDGLLLNLDEDGFYSFTNSSGNILSKGSETNLKFTYKDFRWFLNYAYINVTLDYLEGNPQKPLTPTHNAGSVIMYESNVWRLGYETYYTGKQVLSNGFETTDFIRMGFLAMRNFKWGSLFVNFENFTDRRQSRYTPLVLPPHNNPEFPEIYAPTDGFIFSAGIILKPFGNEHE